MAITRCPDCGRAAEPGICFACGHEWVIGAESSGVAVGAQPATAVPQLVLTPVTPPAPQPRPAQPPAQAAVQRPSHPAPIPQPAPLALSSLPGMGAPPPLSPKDELNDIFGELVLPPPPSQPLPTAQPPTMSIEALMSPTHHDVDDDFDLDLDVSFADPQAAEADAHNATPTKVLATPEREDATVITSESPAAAARSQPFPTAVPPASPAHNPFAGHPAPSPSSPSSPLGAASPPGGVAEDEKTMIRAQVPTPGFPLPRVAPLPTSAPLPPSTPTVGTPSRTHAPSLAAQVPSPVSALPSAPISTTPASAQTPSIPVATSPVQKMQVSPPPPQAPHEAPDPPGFDLDFEEPTDPTVITPAGTPISELPGEPKVAKRPSAALGARSLEIDFDDIAENEAMAHFNSVVSAIEDLKSVADPTTAIEDEKTETFDLGLLSSMPPSPDDPTRDLSTLAAAARAKEESPVEAASRLLPELTTARDQLVGGGHIEEAAVVQETIALLERLTSSAAD